jgi:hypothetical protein
MGASPNLRWVTIVVAAVLAAAVPAGAQEPASPDAAPSTSHAPRPDPAPVKTKPKATVVRAAPRPAAAVTTTASPVAPVAKTPTRAASKPVRRAATHRKKAVRRQHPAKATPKRRTRTVALSLPHLSLTHLTSPPDGDGGRARRLAAGALSLLILALSSATLLAFTARVERRRVAR